MVLRIFGKSVPEMTGRISILLWQMCRVQQLWGMLSDGVRHFQALLGCCRICNALLFNFVDWYTWAILHPTTLYSLIQNQEH